MAALPPLSALRTPMEGELRDPTREELFTAPARALPEEIQQLPAEDTACTFCGVSYFVFAEVQTLQSTVKQYKKTFRQFVQFMERERQEARGLRQQVTELKDNFAQLVASCSATMKQFAEQCETHSSSGREALKQLHQVQQELVDTQDALKELHALSKRNEEELRVTNMLTEQKLSNEILHLSSQVESCKLLSKSQQAAFTAEQDRDRQQIRDLEDKLSESQVHWTAAERQIISERDILKQKLLAATEQIEMETTSARQLETQLTAIREELARVVSASDAERKSSSQMNSEIIQLKHQLQVLERSRAQLLSENGRLKENHYKDEDELTKLRLHADNLQGQLAVSSASTEKVKSEYARELEKFREDHGVEISHLRRDHIKAIEDLKANQANYLEYLKKKTSELQKREDESSRQAIVAMQERLQDVERRANEWKDRALQNASEREEARRASSHFESMVQNMKEKLDASEHSKQHLLEKADTSRHELEKQWAAARQDMAQRQRQFQDANTTLQEHLDRVKSQLEEANQRLHSKNEADPHLKWQTKPRIGGKDRSEGLSNQDCHDNERVTEQLRHALKQKDREISLLQQTVHRECMERTSLLKRMRSGKVLPEVCTSPAVVPALARVCVTQAEDSSSADGLDDDNKHREDVANGEQPKASFYEKLRRAGSRKPKPRK